MIQISLDNNVSQCPTWFINFYLYYLTTIAHSYGSADCFNELLSQEPCTVKYVVVSEISMHMEFETQEDYTTFVLRWS